MRGRVGALCLSWWQRDALGTSWSKKSHPNEDKHLDGEGSIRSSKFIRGKGGGVGKGGPLWSPARSP